ncbi:MAG: DUF1501 domain-containing protein [Pirellulaceae bacterium]
MRRNQYPGFQTPRGMSRRHFLTHMAGATAFAGSSLALGNALAANASTLKRNRKSAILLWMGGGPATIDLWDLKPGQATGGPFKPIATTGEMQICEHLPMIAQQMDKLSIVRNMSTREADHTRGAYYMHTGFVPQPSIQYPSYGSVISQQLFDSRSDLEIPPFVSVGGGSEGPGFLGMAWAPFTVDSNGNVRNLNMGVEPSRLTQRVMALAKLEQNFIDDNRGRAAAEHAKVIQKTLNLLNSQQMSAFRVADEPAEVRERYGDNNFGRGCLMARRLVETGVPFVEVTLGGWDNHQNIFPTLQNNMLPTLDRAMSALVEDLSQRGMLDDTAIIWMGEFGRTPRINGNTGRDHWARSWSTVVGGAGMNPGIAVGQTNEDGTSIEGSSYTSENLMATICKSLGISLETTFTSNNNRPIKIANGAAPISELFA